MHGGSGDLSDRAGVDESGRITLNNAIHELRRRVEDLADGLAVGAEPFTKSSFLSGTFSVIEGGEYVIMVMETR